MSLKDITTVKNITKKSLEYASDLMNKPYKDHKMPQISAKVIETNASSGKSGNQNFKSN